MQGPHPLVFRPRLVLGLSTSGAGLLWLGVLVYLLTFQGVPARTLLSALFFIAFFAVSALYYVRTAIFVDDSGVTYRGMVRTRRIAFTDIRKVQVVPGLVTVYAVQAVGYPMHFTSFFGRHRHLAELLIRRAGLSQH